MLGRLVALTDADEGLCRLVLPLLTDALATQTSGADAEVRACPPCVCVAAARRHAPCFVLLWAQAYAVAGHTLANIGIVCALSNRRWGYDQVVDLLLKLYKFPQFSISRALLHGAAVADPEAQAAVAARRRAAAASGADSRLMQRMNDASVPIGVCGWASPPAATLPIDC